MRRNALAALAAARARRRRARRSVGRRAVELPRQRIELPGDIVVVNVCYNANPMSMRAALDDLAASASGRRVAVLGDMLELGPDEDPSTPRSAFMRVRAGSICSSPSGRAPPLRRRLRQVIALPDAEAAAAARPGLLAPGDTVLLKGSRGVGLEVVARALEGA
jgi:UDP-N-acetylmuramyl pentapeptide synthase